MRFYSFQEILRFCRKVRKIIICPRDGGYQSTDTALKYLTMDNGDYIQLRVVFEYLQPFLLRLGNFPFNKQWSPVCLAAKSMFSLRSCVRRVSFPRVLSPLLKYTGSVMSVQRNVEEKLQEEFKVRRRTPVLSLRKHFVSLI